VSIWETSQRGRRHRARWLAIGAAFVLALLLAGSDTGARGNSGPWHTALTAHFDAHAAAALPPAGDLALGLESLLGQHSVLAADMMRGRIRGDDDFAQAANAALGKNTDAMADAIRSVLGDQAAAKFSGLWAKHITALFSYAAGLADNDATARANARTTLTGFEHDLAGFFAEASAGRLNLQAAQAAVDMHVEHLLQQADAYAAKDWTTSDRVYRESYAHTFGLGKVLAATLLPPDQAAVLAAPVWRLRSELDRLLAEHVVLVVSATRAGVLNSAEFAADGESLNGNTRDLTAAMDALFGSAAAGQFQGMWADHVDALMAYIGGVVGHDAQRRDDAKVKLNDFESKFASFLAGATENRISAVTLAQAFVDHDQMLIRHADAFAAKDYATAYDIAYTTYRHTFDLAGQLADAFGATVAARLPVGGAQTGMGGMADVVGRR
jgi:hypothetical protein